MGNVALLRHAVQRECSFRGKDIWPGPAETALRPNLHKRQHLNAPLSRTPERSTARSVYDGELKALGSTWFIFSWLSRIWKTSWMFGTYPD